MLAIRTLLYIEKNDWIQVVTDHSVKPFMSKVYLLYLRSCIDQAQAKVVITFIDNSGLFWSLSRMDMKRKYYAIQNGTRTTACVRDSLLSYPHRNAVISMTNLFCFGQRDIDLFTQYKHRIDNYYPVGSIIGGYYKSSFLSDQKTTFDLCLVGQWEIPNGLDDKKNNFLIKEVKRVCASLEKLHLFILRFIQETGFDLVICLRNDNDIDEVLFYRNFFGDKVCIPESDRKNFSTYRNIDRSRLAIALNSTPLLDAFSWGKKVLWCNITDDEHYAMPAAGISYFSGNNYTAFKERILMLLNMPQKEYELCTRQNALYINNFNPDNPPHEIIRKTIMKALSE